jgi:lysophospholipase L1-like esterase
MENEIIHYLAWIIISIIFLILIGEMFSRYCLGLGTPPLLIIHPTIEYLYKPNQNVYRFRNHFITNQYGMRAESFSQKKIGDELRVMVFGDSIVNGGNLTDQSELATSLLKDNLSKILRENVIIGNISAGSWGPGNWLAYAQEYGFFDADIIILIISSHDYIDNPTFQPLDKNTHPTEQPVSALLEGIERYLPRYILPIPSSTIVTENNQHIPKKEEVQKGLDDLKNFLKLAKNNSNNVLVFQHYEKSEIESRYPQIGNKLIKEICNQLGIIPTSLEPYFRKSIEDGLNPYHDEIHPTNIGQQLIAEAILAKINVNMK